MIIPDPLTPISLTGSIVGNIATDILKHYAAYLEGSLAGKMLKHAGLLPKTFNDKFGDVLNQSLTVLFDRFPEFRITGVIDFIRDSRFAEQLLGFLLDRKNIDDNIIQQIFTERITSDPYIRIILNRRGIDAQSIVQSFFVCYREVLLKHVEIPQVFLLHEIFKQTDILLGEIRASEERQKEYVKKLFKEHFNEIQKTSSDLWESFLKLCEDRLDIEIRSSIGKKYIPELYVSREIEIQHDEFINKSAWERKEILDQLHVNINELKEGENELTGLINKARNKIAEIESDENHLTAFLKNRHFDTEDDLWRELNSTIIFLDNADEKLKTQLDDLGDELSKITPTFSRASVDVLQLDTKKAEIRESLLKLAEQLRSDLIKQDVLSSLSRKKKKEYDRITSAEDFVSKIREIIVLLIEIRNVLTNKIGHHAYKDTSTLLESINSILTSKENLSNQLGFIKNTISVVKKHFCNCFLIVDRAGSGKTNLFCHLAKKYSRSQPVVFISGRILLENDFSLEEYIVKSISHSRLDIKFENLDRVDDFLLDCGKEGVDKKLLIFIDGINENSNTILLKRGLQKIIASSQSRNILFFISCRDLFWDYFRDEFWHDFLYEFAKGRLYNFTKKEFELALKRYLGYYKIVSELRGDALEKCRQPLLLRFFCEAYGSPEADIANIGVVEEIRLKKLFDDYWERKLSNTKSSLGYRTSRDIEIFLYKISEYMWRNQTRNISLTILRKTTNIIDLDSDKSVYVRLLDEDIIIEEGSSPNLDPWATFVYDEFMEYTMARGILNSIPVDESRENIQNLIQSLMLSYQKFKSVEGILGYLSIMLMERQSPIWDYLITQKMPWTLVAAKAIAQLSTKDITQKELSVLEQLSALDDEIKLEVLKSAEKIYLNPSFDLTSIWAYLFQSFATRLPARDHLIQASNAGKKEALSVFLKVLNNASAHLRAFSVYSLARIQDVEASILLKLIDDPNKSVRRAVAYTLQFFPDGYSGLSSLVNDKHADVRKQACISLSKSNDFNIAIKLINVYANDGDKSVRDAAKDSLLSICHNVNEEYQVLLLHEVMAIEGLLYMEEQDQENIKIKNKESEGVSNEFVLNSENDDYDYE